MRTVVIVSAGPRERSLAPMLIAPPPFISLDLVEQELPALASHLRAVDFDLEATSFRWFFTAYVGSLPSRLVLRIWDAYLAEGRTVRCSGLVWMGGQRGAVRGAANLYVALGVM